MTRTIHDQPHPPAKVGSALGTTDHAARVADAKAGCAALLAATLALLAKQARICGCLAPLGPWNRSGRCRSCTMRHNRPAIEAKRAEGFRRRLAEDKDFRQAHNARVAARAAEWRVKPEAQDAIREHCRKANLAANTSEGRAKSADTRRRNAMGWCPDDRIADYEALRSRFGAIEARRLVEDEIAVAERRRIAAMTPLERQLERVRNGATISDKVPLRRADHDFTLGGVAGYGS